jgi:hypothetical protein
VSIGRSVSTALRDVLGMTGTKFGCGIAQCGACTVFLDGRPLRSCSIPVSALDKGEITTIEAVTGEDINTRVAAAAGVSPDDLMITLYEAPGENFSFGQGEAQRAHAVQREQKSHAARVARSD